MVKYFQLILVMLLLVGCGNSDDDEDSGGLFSFNSQTREEFLPLDQYQYDDFDLSEDVLYWETRVGPAQTAGFPVVFRSELLFFYAQEDQTGLFEDRLDELATISEPLTGFADKCPPGSCLAYVAGIGFDDLFTITTQQELSTFFGNIDTEAELAYWLWSEDFIPIDYLVEDGGFEATVETNEICAQRSRLRVFVDRNGVITPTENLDSEGLQSCEGGTDRQDDVLFQDESGVRDEPIGGAIQDDGLFIQSGGTAFSGEGLIIQSGDLNLLNDGLTIQAGNLTPETGGLIFQGGTVPIPSQDLIPGEASSTLAGGGLAGQGSSAQFTPGTVSGGNIVLQDRTESVPSGQTRFESGQ